MVMQVAQSDAHVSMNVIGNSDGETESENAVGHAQRVEIAIAKEEKAGDDSPDKREEGKQRIGDVGKAEEQGSEGDALPAARSEAQEARQKIAVYKELLHERPDEVSRHVGDEGRTLSEETVQGVQAKGQPYGQCGQHEREADDPER